MAINTPFYPYATTNAAGSFSVQSAGYVQGVFMDDPAARYGLSMGNLSASATGPVWGGMAISEFIPSAGVDGTLGSAIAPATASANLSGFSVFNQAYSMVGSPQSPVPLAGSTGASVAYFRMGSGARIAVAADPSLVSLDGGLTTQSVSFDFNNQILVPSGGTATVAVTSITSSFANGVYTFAVVTAAAANVDAVGDEIFIAGVTGTGAALVNGSQTITSFTDNQHFTFQITAPTGAIATGALTGTITLVQNTAVLPVKVLAVNVGNSMTVSFNANTGAATWNRQGTTALILI
jgi:hypothetical protein